jgi:hypothetical protein
VGKAPNTTWAARVILFALRIVVKFESDFFQLRQEYATANKRQVMWLIWRAGTTRSM